MCVEYNVSKKWVGFRFGFNVCEQNLLQNREQYVWDNTNGAHTSLSLIQMNR